MRKLTLFFLAAILGLATTSCAKMQAKHQISRLESLVERVEKQGNDLSRQQWSQVKAEYDEICAKMKQYEYTAEQLQEIGRLKGRFYAACTKNALNAAGGWFNDFIEQAGGVINGFLDGLVTYPDDTPKESSAAQPTDQQSLP